MGEIRIEVSRNLHNVSEESIYFRRSVGVIGRIGAVQARILASPIQQSRSIFVPQLFAQFLIKRFTRS